MRASLRSVPALQARYSGNLVRGMYDEAKKVSGKILRTALEKDNFFLELQDHGIPEQRLVNQQLLRLSQDTGIRACGDE